MSPNVERGLKIFTFLLALVVMLVIDGNRDRVSAAPLAAPTPNPGAMTVYSVDNANSVEIEVQHVFTDTNGFNFSFWSTVPANSSVIYHVSQMPQIPSPFNGSLTLFSNQPFSSEVVGYDYPNSPTASTTATSSPTPTNSTTATATATPSPTPAPSASLTPTLTTATSTPSTTATSSPTPTNSTTATATATPSLTPAPSASPSTSPSSTNVVSGTPIALPTATATPTLTVEPSPPAIIVTVVAGSLIKVVVPPQTASADSIVRVVASVLSTAIQIDPSNGNYQQILTILVDATDANGNQVHQLAMPATISITFRPAPGTTPPLAQISTLDLNGNVQLLPTLVVSNDDGTYTATAQTPHFSTFTLSAPVRGAMVPQIFIPAVSEAQSGT